MKHFIARITTLFALTAVVACSENPIEELAPNTADSKFVQEISITGKDFIIDDETRSTVVISNEGVKFLWDEDDVIGIFPDKGDQVSFAMNNGVGTQTATFTGGGWALKSSAQYAAYYPHVYENRDLTNVPISYLGQAQSGNATTNHIGDYDFMAASVATPANGAVAFDMQHLGCLVQLTLNLQEDITIKNVSLKYGDEDSGLFTTEGKIDLTAENPVITATETSNIIDIATEGLEVSADESATIYFMIAPANLGGKEIEIIVTDVNDNTRSVQIQGKNFVAGKAYALANSVVPFNQIWYTSTNGEIVTPHETDVFGATIQSNVYENGKGVITFDGKVTTIGEYAFSGKSTLTGITIPKSVTSIGGYAFNGCSRLQDIVIPNSVVSVGDYVFDGCNNLPVFDGIRYADTYLVGVTDNSVSRNYSIKDGTRFIGSNAFKQCTYLSSITIPNSVISIGEQAFWACI